VGQILWLASYPKSGNTWLRTLLSNYLSESASPVPLDRLTGGPIASARSWFDDWAGVEASALDPALVARLRPEVYRKMAADSPGLRFMKVHDAWSLTDAGEPMFPVDATAGVIYVVRNPLDLVGACAHHWGVSDATAVDRLGDAETPVAAGRLTEQLPEHLGSWSDHVRAWTVQSGLRLLMVRYEDLHRATLTTFSEVLSFCGYAVDDLRLSAAVGASRFESLRAQEQREGFAERSPQAPGPFFRRGAVGSWRDELGPELARRVVDTHGETMAQLGYETDLRRGD
jgi:aryl sulfotransferase